MAEDTGQERTEDATSKRREDSRKKGQVARSKELNTFISLLSAGVGMVMFGKEIINDISYLLTDSLSFGHKEAFGEMAITMQLSSTINQFVVLLSPLLLLLVLSTFVGPIMLGGWIFTMNSLAPKFERISPIKGLARIFSAKGLMELIKAIGKFLLVGSVTVFVISQVLSDIFVLPVRPLADALNSAGGIFIWCFLGFSSVLVLIALIDVPFQIHDHNKQLKMTKQEIKDEMKESEGKPEVKSAIRQKQHEISQQRMMSEVPKADVVITNPTHFAVALSYDQDGSGAPKVVAKGRDLIAARIREIAKENKVAIFAAPPLARALYASTDIDQEIPGNLFLAVAQVLAYIFQLRKMSPGAGVRPTPPVDLPVPDEYEKKMRGKV